MGVYSKINRARKKATSAVTKPFIKGISKISDKLIPNELRFLAPYAAGIGTLMLPPTMSPFMRALAASGYNIAGQIGSNESEVDDISDLNAMSIALSGGIGALGSNQMGSAANAPQVGGPESNPLYQTKPGFLEGVGNVAGKGVDLASDFVQGNRSTLAGFGEDPGKLASLGGLKDAASALGTTLSQGTEIGRASCRERV